MIRLKRTVNYLQNIIQETKDWTTQPPKTGTELKCSGKGGSSSSSSGGRCVNVVTYSVICHEWGKDRIGITTNGTYVWSFVTQISAGVNQVMVATVTFSKGWLQLGTLGSVASTNEIMRGTTSHRISYQLSDMSSICVCCVNVAPYKWKVYNVKSKSFCFVVSRCLMFPWLYLIPFVRNSDQIEICIK